MVVLMSELSDYLATVIGDRVADDIVARAAAMGHSIHRSAVYAFLDGTHARNPRESTLQALAAGFDIDVRVLRRLAGRPMGELGPYVPVEVAGSLTETQRRALDDLILSIVNDRSADADLWREQMYEDRKYLRERTEVDSRLDEVANAITNFNYEIDQGSMSAADYREYERLWEIVRLNRLAAKYGVSLHDLDQEDETDASDAQAHEKTPTVDTIHRPPAVEYQPLKLAARRRTTPNTPTPDLDAQATAGEENQDPGEV